KDVYESSSMKFLDRFQNAQKIWELALPTVSLPPNETLIGWLAVYSDAEFEAAIVRTPYRLSQGGMGRGQPHAQAVYRLISSLLKNNRQQTANKKKSENRQDVESEPLRKEVESCAAI